jgi:ATP-dependent helicase/nuclease subunit B
MSLHLYLAPAASGKTTYALKRVREAAQGLQATPRVVVPTHLQVRAWRRRLAGAGGAIGVRLLTFDGLYAECLNAAGEVYTELSEPVQYRLIRAIVDRLPLAHYAPLTDRPGFVQVLQELVGELKAARAWPEDFAQAITALGDEPRLGELAQVYAAYQDQLQAQGWADRAGLGWLAVEALGERVPDVARDWPLLVVDGFDNFTPVQLALLEALADRVGELIITLTGAVDGSPPRQVHRRFNQTRQRLEAALGGRAEALPEAASLQAAALAHLEAHLFESHANQVDGTAWVELIEAPDRAGEVRAALRWLKARLVRDGMQPGQVALLARSLPPYRSFILQTAAEFGLPMRLVDGLPMRANPVVVAVLDMLRLMLPRADGDPEPALPRRRMVEAWRSPYFEWAAFPEEGAPEPIGITPGDADALDAVARWGRVIGGLSQWEEVLDSLAAYSEEVVEDEDQGIPPGDPAGSEAPRRRDQAGVLRDKFQRFVQRLTPPSGEHPMHDFVGWLEALIGTDPELQSPRSTSPEEPTALRIVARAREAPHQTIVDRDVAALQAFKDILRGLVWAEEALGSAPVDFPRFLDELVGAVEAARFTLPVHPAREEILVADVVQARGVPFRAVALLGLAEGEFPATLGEDPFLRNADRARMREGFNLLLEPSTESAEVEFFYETITRPRERLLLTRPRLADNGAPWQASPFWEEVCRLVTAQSQELTSESIATPDQAASWPELMESLVAHHGYGEVWDWVRGTEPARQATLNAAAGLFRRRRDVSDGSPDGDLRHMAGIFAQRFGPAHVWSSSRLEAYRTCPFLFFVGSVLHLEPRAEPAEGLDARQLGSIYHRILEQLYQRVDDPADLEQLLSALPDVAGAVLDEAPGREGFRETAWWSQTRAEILEDVRRSLQALAQIQEDFIPSQYEVPFGLWDQPVLVVRDGEDSFRLRGLIDRVDRTPDGRLRVIDYKTAGPASYNKKAVTEGKKIQLPLYALAARDALGLGEPVEGFYWHVRHAQPSRFTLSGFDGGPEAAMGIVVEKVWETVREARAGHFMPQPPDNGCPPYCPAAGFCWRYQPGFGG